MRGILFRSRAISPRPARSGGGGGALVARSEQTVRCLGHRRQKKPGEPPPGVLPTVRTEPKGYLPSPIFSIRALVSGLWPRKRS